MLQYLSVPGGSLAVHDLTGNALGGTADAAGTDTTDNAPAGAITDAPDAARATVVAVHGITSNALAWVPVAQELARRRGPAVRVLAVDVRGRACSRGLGPPYGIARDVEDVVALLDSLDVTAKPVVVTGHSMGAFVAAGVASARPERVDGMVLVDGGLAFAVPVGVDIDAMLQALIGPSMQRLAMTFAGPEAYLDFWGVHPALGPLLRGPLRQQVADHLLHDLIAREKPDGGPAEFVSSCVTEAIRADGADTFTDPAVRDAVRQVVEREVPTELLWAPRGLLDEPQGIYDEPRLSGMGLDPRLGVRCVPGTNHFSIMLAPVGVTAVVDALERRLDRR